METDTATYTYQQRFTMRSGVLTGNDIRWRSASIAATHCPNERSISSSSSRPKWWFSSL